MSQDNKLEAARIMATLPRSISELADLRRAKKFEAAGDMARKLAAELAFVAWVLNKEEPHE